MKKLRILGCLLFLFFLLTSCGTASENRGKAIQKSGYSTVGRELLSGKLKNCYDEIDRSVYQLKEEIPVNDLDEEELRRVIEYYRADHPQIFWLRNDYSYECRNGKVKKLSLAYGYLNPQTGEKGNLSLAEVRRADERLSESADAVLSGILPSMSEYEILRYLHDYLIAEVEYDENYAYQHTAYGALVGKRAVCDGYAGALSYLLSRLGMESRMVYGSGADGTPHAWNVVKTGGEYYHMDITWDIPPEGISSPLYTSFNITGEQAREKRVIYSPTEGTDGGSFSYYLPIPECTATKYQYYRYHGTLISDYADGGREQMLRYLQNAARKGQESVQFHFERARDFREFLKEFFSPDSPWRELTESGIEAESCEEERLILFFMKKPQ